MKPCEWTIFYSESTGRYGCVPTYSKRGLNIKEATALKGFFGTEKEAIAETKRIEKAAAGTAT